MPPTVPPGPLTVDVINHASVWTWLAPVLTFCGSVLLFVGAMITVWWTNRAASSRSKAEIEATHDRDFRTWQRDNQLRLTTEVVESVNEAQGVYWRIAKTEAKYTSEPLDTALRRIGVGVHGLRMIGARETAKVCVELNNAIWDYADTVHRLKSDRMDGSESTASEHGSSSEARQAEDAEAEKQMEHIKTVRTRLTETVEAELARNSLQTAAQTG